MAKKSRGKGSKKYYPVQRTVRCVQNPPTTRDKFELRVDHELSKANHRLYRQSRVYSVKIDIEPQFTGVTVEVFALRPTWMAMKAYQEAYNQFTKNSMEERSNGNDARWNDFRVQSGGQADANLIGLGATDLTDTLQGSAYSSGEYIYSRVHDAAGNARTFAWSGGSGGGVYDIMAEYDNYANTDATPSSPIGTVPYDDLHDEVDDGQKNHLQNDGNLPPYGASSLDPEVFTKVATLLANTGDSTNAANRLSTGFFDAPCGLVLIRTGRNLDATTEAPFTFTVKAGDYKGVEAHPMLEL